MGIIISKFRKQPTTLEKLKKIEDGLRRIEDYKRSTEQKQKRTVANLVVYGLALYMLACVIVFVWFLPESWLVRLALLVPLTLVPLIIYLMKRLISRYFDSKMLRANEEYGDLQRKKKDLIDSIMETETFNKAKEILSRYAPEKLEKKEYLVSSGTVAVKQTGDLRKRNITSANPSSTKAEEPPPRKPNSTVPSYQVQLVSTQKFTDLVPQLKLPQPLFSKDRSLGDKLVEYIVGDGPGYRYALICKFCREHNGMALREEFPYMSFSCCYCRKLNPARITRPTAPRLPEPVAESPRGILGAQSSRASVSRDERVSKLVPLDKYVDELGLAQEVQDTDENMDPVTACRISNTDINETSVESEENFPEPEDVSKNASEKDSDYCLSNKKEELVRGASGTSAESQNQEETSKENPTGGCDGL